MATKKSKAGAPQESSYTLNFFSGFGGMFLTHSVGLLSSKLSKTYAGAISSTVSGLTSALLLYVGSRENMGQAAGYAAAGGVAGAVLTLARNLMGMSKANFLRDMGGLERALDAAPAAQGQLPAQSQTAQGSQSSSASGKKPKTKTTKVAASVGKVLADAVVTSDGMWFAHRTQDNSAIIPNADLTSSDEDGNYSVIRISDKAVLVDGDSKPWTVDDEGMLVTKGHDTEYIWTVKGQDVDLDTNQYWGEGNPPVATTTEGENKGTLEGLVDVDSMSGLVDVDSMSGLVDVDSMSGLVDVDSMGGLVDVDSMGGLVDVDSMNGQIEEADLGRQFEDFDLGGIVDLHSVDGMYDPSYY